MRNCSELYNHLRNKVNVTYPIREAGSIAMLLMERMGFSQNDIIIGRDLLWDSKTEDTISMWLTRIASREPIQYVLGEAHFMGLTLKVNPSVLIPRQETEELVQLVVDDLDSEEPGKHKVRILDIGTGSGCIALSLKNQIPLSDVSALDSSKDALSLAKTNAIKLGLNVHFFQQDVLTEAQLEETYDIIVSNPPYVRESEKPQMDSNIKDHEPSKALFVASEYPLVFYECIIELARRSLETMGRLYFEINEAFHDEIGTLLIAAGFNDVQVIKDMHGRFRFAKGVKP